MTQKFPTPAAVKETLPVDYPGRRRLPPLLRKAWYNLNQAFRRRIAPMDITPDQFTVLRVLVENGEGISQREICDYMTSDPNTITSILNRMESQDFVERRPHETDRRALSIWIKPAGQAKYHETREFASGLQREVLDVLSAAEQEQFLEHLERIAGACSRAVEDSTGKTSRPI